MAHVETWYRCPTCRGLWKNRKEAQKCKDSHTVIAEQWAVGKHQSVPIFPNHASNSIHGVFGAMREADLSPFIKERAKQLEEEKNR